jgi:hypothetical protein
MNFVLRVTKNKGLALVERLQSKRRAIERTYRKETGERLVFGAMAARPRSVSVIVAGECRVNCVSDAIGEHLGDLAEFVKLPYWG